MSALYLDDYLPAATKDDVNAERDRRLLAGFLFRGKRIQADMASQSAIAINAQRAKVAVDSGASPDYLRWADTERDFMWIAADNTMLVELQQLAASHLEMSQRSARRLKDRIAAGERIVDVTEDALWLP
jgi:hypothetical protein